MIEQKETYYRFILGYRSRKFFLFFALMVTTFLLACSNSQSPETDNPFSQDDIEQNLFSSGHPASSSSTSASSTSQQSESSSSKTPAGSSSIKEYLPLDDTEYPYAGIPRIVIETENFKQIKDRETEIPAKLQVWGERAPISEILKLTIKGRGYSSWNMPKKSYKIEFCDKFSFGGFPKDRDWDLIANYADKTLLRNHISYKLSSWLHAEYSPRTAFYELYLNNKYQGIYMLTEHIKVAKNRVNIPQNGTGFLIERELPPDITKTNITTKNGTNYEVRFPRNNNIQYIDSLTNFLDKWESFKNSPLYTKDSLKEFLDIDAYVKFYWVQEFSKNNDAAYNRSIFSTWQIGGPLKYGPVWDFDVAYGNKSTLELQNYENWHIRTKDWNKRIIKNQIIQQKIRDFWKENQHIFKTINDSIDVYSKQLSQAAKNEYKRWDIADQPKVSNSKKTHSYAEAISNLKQWINGRIAWINQNYD